MKTYIRVRLEYPLKGVTLDGEILSEDANEMYRIMMESENSPQWIASNEAEQNQ